jgi:hypothetical protein
MDSLPPSLPPSLRDSFNIPSSQCHQGNKNKNKNKFRTHLLFLHHNCGKPKNKTNKIEIKHITITQAGKLRLDPAEEDTQRKLSTEHESTSCRTLKFLLDNVSAFGT